MKLIQSTVKGIEYKFICLENEGDLFAYQTIDEQIKSKQACNFWFGFHKSRRTSVSDYAVHETEGNNNLPNFLALQIEFSEKAVSIVDYCTMADKIIHGVYKTMMELINKGDLVRINRKGGYCNIKKEELLNDYHTKIDIDEKQLYSFLLNGEINIEYNINCENVIIENGNYVDSSIISSFIAKTGKSDIQILDYFKQNTLLFKEEDYVKFFSDGITKYNLKNIAFQTTAQDEVQVQNVKKVLEYVMSKHKDKKLNVYIKTSSDKKNIFETSLSNINITYL